MKKIPIKSIQEKNNNFLYSIFAQFCLDYCCNKEVIINKEREKKRTILIDTRSCNNLGYLDLNLVKKSSKYGFDIHKVLDNIIITRAFIFYQLANIIIHELPKLIDQQIIVCKIQIIVMDLLDTLLQSSLSSSK